MFRKILVPYDGSEPSERALQQAVSIAKSVVGSKPEVIVLHVIAQFPTYHFIERPARSIRTGEKTTVSEYVKEINELMEKNAAEVLSRKREQVKKLDDFEINAKILSGHIVNTILTVVKKEAVDLIVLGNVGRSGMSRLRTLGSVSRGVSERASCPVMIIH